MKKIIFSIFCLLGLNSCNGQKNNLNDSEIKLIGELKLDKETAQEIKSLTNGNFELAKGFEDRENLYDDIPELKNYSKKLPKAIKINSKEDIATKIVKDFKQKLIEKGLIIYKSEENYNQKDDVITILKSENKYEPLYFEGTNAVNYDMNTPQLIEKLKVWDKLYGIELNGVGFDYLSGDFKKLPDDLRSFSTEMYDFCPDIVDQGVGDLDKLIEALKDSKSFFLWWD
ncbi:DUF4253 domain-containing protein [Myroides sp. JBRI-B21084]|uniref:DUF4253 domain-containing protein n=1 Tax=Myroides sp. JBRI-B21084 TaxID=3119977 RepID=UPI0026E1CF69|nr:DUF4253 domain-containing protein [Paenimyroides cloacae]WKW45496.1 DUF4253 domain-containing protein [Paenimyroides cloacae]WKW46889.1 DUF4253 domain-containing protein [Paenimyroides cloacae]